MRGNIEQAWFDRVKILRAAIRLKHSIAADNEINARVDEEKKRFFKKVQQGELPKPLDTGKVMDA